MSEVNFIVGRDGSIKTEMAGFKDGKCSDLADLLKNALGNSISEQKKWDYENEQNQLS